MNSALTSIALLGSLNSIRLSPKKKINVSGNEFQTTINYKCLIKNSRTIRVVYLITSKIDAGYDVKTDGYNYIQIKIKQPFANK